MSKAAFITVSCAAILQSLMVCIGNSFTIFVFWIHRNKLKRTSFLLINLAFADLLVGFTEILVIGPFILPLYTDHAVFDAKSISGNISLSFQAAFSAVSVFFLALIAMERAFALIWPLRHRTTSIKVYICSVTIAWIDGITVGAMNLLVSYDSSKEKPFAVSFTFIMVSALVLMLASYLGIRKHLNYRGPGMDSAHNRQSMEKITKLSKTLFIVIAASLVFWVPTLAFHCVYYWYKDLVSNIVIHLFWMLRMTNSLVNPVIYSFRVPVFRKTLKHVKNSMGFLIQSKTYTVNHGT